MKSIKTGLLIRVVLMVVLFSLSLYLALLPATSDR